MYVNSELLLTSKGGKRDGLDNLKISTYCLELQVHIGIKQRLSGKLSLFEEAGPYMDFVQMKVSKNSNAKNFNTYFALSYLF